MTAISYAARTLAAGIAVATLGAANPAAAFNVDGILSAGEGYTATYNVGFTVENGPTVNAANGAVLSIGRDTDSNSATFGDVFLHLSLPTDLVDNYYSDTTRPASWVSANKDHKYSDLAGSDGFQFTIHTDASNTQSLSAGYIGKDPTTNLLSDAETSNSSSTIKKIGSSLQYNLTGSPTFGDTKESPTGPTSSGGKVWQEAVQYEVELDGSQFSYLGNGNLGLAEITSSVLHVSPNKLGKNKVTLCLDLSDSKCATTTTTTTTDVPEPASGALMVVGLGLVSLYRRRRARGLITG